MRLFVYEYTCGPALPLEFESLRPQGAAMLRAVLEDFARLPDVSVVSLVSEPIRLAVPNVTLIRSSADEERGRFRACLMEADMALVIAPEFDDLLYERVRWVEEAGVPTLNPTSAAVQLCGDKLALCRHLQARGIPAPTWNRGQGRTDRGQGTGDRGQGREAATLTRSASEGGISTSSGFETHAILAPGGARMRNPGGMAEAPSLEVDPSLALRASVLAPGGARMRKPEGSSMDAAPRERSAKQSFADVRSQTEFGNEEVRPVFPLSPVPCPLSPLLPLSPVPCPLSPLSFPAVLKPRHGAGSLATFLVHSDDELAAALRHAHSSGLRDDAILEPWVAGRAASVSFLVGPRQATALPPAWQILSDDGRFDYLGGVLPVEPDFAERAIALAARAIRAVPGLHGYVGVDLVLGPRSDGADDRVIEINPRLTTSYVGLRALASGNLAQCLLDVTAGRQPSVAWRPGCQVRFDPTGRIVENVLPGSGVS